MLHLADIERAGQIVYRHMQPTPTLAWPMLRQDLGCDVWVKHENQTPIGAFKVRGGLVYLEELRQQGFTGELVTATRGNHGQSIPFAARLQGRAVHVFVPEGNSAEKNAAMQGWGADLQVCGADFDVAREHAQQAAQDNGWHLVPSFHEHLVRGVATYGAEIFAALDSLDAIYVPIGMGSGAASLIAVRDALARKTEIIGVVSAHANAVARSFAQGRVTTTNSAHTFADGMATRVPHPDAFDILSRGLARVVEVTDDEVAAAVRLLFRTTHNVAEGAGAAATAALCQEQKRQRGRKVAVVLSGGNIDTPWLQHILAGGTPQVGPS